MVWRAEITDTEGKTYSMVSGTEIRITFIEEGGVVIFLGEYDTVGVSLDALVHFRIYQTGPTAL